MHTHPRAWGLGSPRRGICHQADKAAVAGRTPATRNVPDTLMTHRSLATSPHVTTGPFAGAGRGVAGDTVLSRQAVSRPTSQRAGETTQEDEEGHAVAGCGARSPEMQGTSGSRAGVRLPPRRKRALRPTTQAGTRHSVLGGRPAPGAQPEGPVRTSDPRKRTILTELLKPGNLKHFVTGQRDLSPARPCSFGRDVPTAGAWRRPREARWGPGPTSASQPLSGFPSDGTDTHIGRQTLGLAA